MNVQDHVQSNKYEDTLKYVFPMVLHESTICGNW